LGIRLSLLLRPIKFLLFLLPAACFAQIVYNPQPSRVLGSDSTTLNNFNPNLVEGREFMAPQGIALDTSTTPPGLYVSDTNNNRVLGFHNATSFTNGQKADVVLGQPDFLTTLPSGPSQSNTATTSMTAPTGVTVDSQGNVYVVDTGNNRILRFPQPFAQTGARTPDIAIGQASFTTNGANQGGISASTLSFTSNGAIFSAFIAFDATGNLWVADAGNNRVLRFNASVLATGALAASGPSADLVLGQPGFASNGYTPPANPLTSTTAFTTPTGIVFDTAGRLFVEESIATRRGRILVWAPPFTSTQPAGRILGVDSAFPAPPAVSPYQLAQSPGALFAIGNGIGVADINNNRIVVFPPVEQWTPNATFQTATEVAGQINLFSGSANQGASVPNAGTLALPNAATFFNSELYVADAGNNRVVVMPAPQNGDSFGPATRVLGQDAMNLNSPNLVEGREFDFQSLVNGSVDAGIAIDMTSSPPHLYVADTYNNRILGFSDLRKITTGAKADIVIGQPDFQRTLINYPSNDPTQPNASGLSVPIGLAVDPQGNLYVADIGNSRVLRFPTPFANYTPGTPEQADLVLGQAGFSGARITDPTDRTMAAPYGLTFAYAGGLLVSDLSLNRVLYFGVLPQNLTSGMAATGVLGQPDFNSAGIGSGPGQLNAPHHISIDTDDRLYVADTGNARVSIYNHAPTSPAGTPAAYFLTQNLTSPRGVYISPASLQIWVTDPVAGAAIRYPAFSQLIEANGAPNAKIVDARPVAVVEDIWGNVYIPDGVSRVGVFYPGIAPINAANFLQPRVLAPGMIAALFTQGYQNQFGGQPTQSSALPLPTTLNGIQVLFNGTPVPLFYADPNQINFQVPIGAPQSGTADMQVVDVATGRLLGDTTVVMTAALPGVFTQAGNGIGPAIAINQDNTLNTQTNPAVQGSVITIYGTGQGFIAGAPPDGNVLNKALPTPANPVVIIGFGPVPDANIQYSGLSPALVGVWQLNIVIPDSVITLPDNPTQIILIENNVPSGGAGIGRDVLIYVKAKS
jgi:uncharacterized protein (TIGR03437 family)